MSRPSINTRPEVGASSPAMRRRTVLFPLPDGPTSTSSSPSAISSVSSRAATCPFAWTLLTFSSAIDAMSALHRSGSEACDDPPLRHQGDRGDGKRRDDGGGENLSPRHLVLAAEQRDRHWNGIAFRTERERQREQELIPTVKKCEDSDRRDSGPGERQDDVPEDPQTACAVDERGLLQRNRQLTKEADEQPDRKRHREGEIWQHKTGIRVHQMELSEDQVE